MMEFISHWAWELATLGYAFLGLIIFVQYKISECDDRIIREYTSAYFNAQEERNFAQIHLKIYQKRYEDLLKKQIPRDKNGRFARKGNK